MVTVDEYFGIKAGILWQCLHEHGALSIVQIKRKTKLSDTDVYGALGWLSHEQKIAIHGSVPLLYKFSLK
ncbi:MAG: winged helix-turn-helix domain-containing protein [Candidatus Micrarchaeota archaeon]